MATLRRLSLLVPLVVLSFGCGDGFGPDGPPRQITELPRDLSAAEAKLIAADNEFGLKLFRQIRAEEGDGRNLFISPLSVAMALGMTYNGAAGSTESAMRGTLELGDLSREEINAAYRDVIDLLSGLDRSVRFKLANSIWYRQGLAVRQEFIGLNREYFDAEVAALDFNAPEAAATINNWVDEKTEGRIEDIVADPIANDLVMFLINAIYFKGSWTARFDPALTRPGPFTLSDGTRIDVPMMSTEDAIDVGYFADENVTVVDLPYGGQAYSMTIVLPDTDRDLAEVIEGLEGDTWRTWVEGLEVHGIVITMPKFTLEYELEMNDVLKALGMAIAFDRNAADFSLIADVSPERLYISEVKHKTFVEVNEEGTEAAAATSVGVGVTSADPTPPRIVIDRPFAFAIRERLSGTILFVGAIERPEGGVIGNR